MAVEIRRQIFFRQMLKEQEPVIGADRFLFKCLDNLTITNIVATANLSVKAINLRRIAEENFFCNYHKCTFAAMGIRLQGGSAALLYSMGVMVCMGTTSTTGAMLACTKYCQVLNSLLGVDCHITGFQADNYVCTIFTFTLDLHACIRKDWATVIEYDKVKFPGATVRCKFMGLDFKTDVVMEFFESGKINITGAKSIYEARYMFIIVYFRYIQHIRVNNNDYRRQRVLDIKDEPIFDTDLIVPVVNTNEEELEKYRMFVRLEDENGKMRYMDENDHEIPIDPKYKHLPYEEIDKLILAMGTKPDF